MNNTIPYTITYTNRDNYAKTLTLSTVKSSTIIENTEDYFVSVRKFEIPFNNGFTPINSSTVPYKVLIFNEYKETEMRFNNLSYGANFFEINGPIYSVETFIKQLNDIVFGKMKSETSLGQFIIDGEQKISYSYPKEFAPEHDMLKIYFNWPIRRLINFNYDLEDRILHNGDEYVRFKAVTDYTVGSGSGSINESKFSYPLFYNIKAVRVYSNLPTCPWTVDSIDKKQSVDTNLIADITFNSVYQYNESNFLYNPESFQYLTMNNLTSLNKMEFEFYLSYADGQEYSVIINSGEFAKIFLVFIKKNLVNENPFF